MAQYKQRSEAESLRRSHSGFSNFKLTLLCLLCALAVTVFVASLATIGSGLVPAGLLTAVTVVSGALTLVSFFLISAFRR